MQENLLDGDLTSEQSRLLEEADSFDLEYFYLNKGASTGGVCLITDNQMIMTDCYVKNSKRSSYGKHIYTVDAIYNAIYGIESIKEKTQKFWQGEILDDGNIIIQLCSTVPTLIWIPEEISENKCKFLTTFSKRINQIVANNPEYFEKHPIQFEYFIEGIANGMTNNSIKEVLRYTKVKELKHEKTI